MENGEDPDDDLLRFIRDAQADARPVRGAQAQMRKPSPHTESIRLAVDSLMAGVERIRLIRESVKDLNPVIEALRENSGQTLTAELVAHAEQVALAMSAGLAQLGERAP